MQFFAKTFLLLLTTTIKDGYALGFETTVTPITTPTLSTAANPIHFPNASNDQIPISKALHQAALLFNNHVFCAGSIISNRWILTAAYCSEGLNLNLLRIRVGSADLSQGGQLLQASQFITHPKYNSTNRDQDVGLIRVTEKITAGRSISLASVEPTGGTDVLSSGWGSQFLGVALSNQLRQVEIEIVSRAKCRAVYEPNVVTNRMICATRPGGDNCQGDIGGPLRIEGSSLVGIASWGIACADQRFAMVYTNIADVSILNFINKYVQ